MGSVDDCYDNAMMESFWGTLQLEVLDRKSWNSRDELANAIFEWIECWYNPTGAIPASECSVRLTSNNSTPHQITAVDPKPRVSGDGGSSQPDSSFTGFELAPSLNAKANQMTVRDVLAIPATAPAADHRRRTLRCDSLDVAANDRRRI
jgi:hypothetical protein